MDPLKNIKTANYFTLYRWCKINIVKWFFKDFIIENPINLVFDVPERGKTSVYKAHFAIPPTNFTDFISFYLTWEHYMLIFISEQIFCSSVEWQRVKTVHIVLFINMYFASLNQAKPNA